MSKGPQLRSEHSTRKPRELIRKMQHTDQQNASQAVLGNFGGGVEPVGDLSDLPPTALRICRN